MEASEDVGALPAIASRNSLSSALRTLMSKFTLGSDNCEVESSAISVSFRNLESAELCSVACSTWLVGFVLADCEKCDRALSNKSAILVLVVVVALEVDSLWFVFESKPLGWRAHKSVGGR